MPHTYTNLLCHIVYSTKERYPFINSDIRSRFYDYLGGTIRGLNGVSLEIGGIADHVHLLVKLKPTASVSKFLQDLKSNTSSSGKEIVHPKFEWQEGYGAFTVGESQIEGVRRYIQNQEIHHRKMNFEKEFKELLKMSGIEFDEQFLWR